MQNVSVLVLVMALADMFYILKIFFWKIFVFSGLVSFRNFVGVGAMTTVIGQSFPPRLVRERLPV